MWIDGEVKWETTLVSSFYGNRISQGSVEDSFLCRQRFRSQVVDVSDLDPAAASSPNSNGKKTRGRVGVLELLVHVRDVAEPMAASIETLVN